MKIIVKRLIKKCSIDKRFVNNFSKLICGTASAQFVGIVTVPILTQIYGVEAYGVQAVYVSIASILGIFATGKYETAILLPEDDEKGFLLSCLVILLSIIFSVIWYLGYSVFSNEIFVYFCGIDVLYWLQWLPFTLIATSLYSVVTIYLNRMKDYSVMATAGVMSSVINFLFAVIYSLVYPDDNFGLYFNTFAGNLVVSIIFILYCHRRMYFNLSWWSWHGLYGVASIYMNMPKYLLFGSTLNELSSRLPVFLLQGFAGELVVGWYSMGLKLLGMPLQLVSSAVGNVFLREAAEEWNKKHNCWISSKKTLSVLVITGIVPATLLFFFSCDMFSFFLGNNWYMAGVYCTYLIPMYYIKFVFSPVSNVLLIANKQQIFLYLQFCRIIVIYAGMQLGYILYGSADAIIVFYGASFSLYYLIVLMYCVRTSVNKNSPINCDCKL